jgi:hypothetical protein
MGIVVGNISSSGDAGSPNTSFSWNHEVATGSNILIAVVRFVDSSSEDSDITGVTFNAGGFTGEALYYRDSTSGRGVAIWYLINPTTESSLPIEVTFAGKVSDAAGGAIDLSGVDTGDPIDDTNTKHEGTLSETISITVSGSVSSGAVGIAGVTNSLNDNDEVSITTGNSIDAVDMGGNSALSGRNTESGSSITVAWECSPDDCWYDAGIIALKPAAGDKEINVDDGIQVGENVTLLQANYVPSVSDDIGVGEDITTFKYSPFWEVNIFDEVGVSETITSRVPTEFIDIYDGIDAGEDITARAGPLYINVSDGIDVSENIVLLIPSGTANVTDGIDIEESISIKIPKCVANVYDSVEIAESLDVENILQINVYDGIDIGENLTVEQSEEEQTEINISEGIEVGELITSRVPTEFVDVYDGIDVGESVTTLQANYVLSLSDGVEVGESITGELLTGAYSVNVSDGIEVEDYLLYYPDSVYVRELVTVERVDAGDVRSIDLDDGIQIGESIVALIPSGQTEVADGVEVGENITAVASVSINVADGIEVGESITTNLIFNIDIYDGIEIQDDITIERLTAILEVDIYDGIDTGESILRELNNNVVVFNGIDIGESIIPFRVLAVYEVNVLDGIEIAENITFGFSTLNINVNDGTNLSEKARRKLILLDKGNLAVSISSLLHFEL